MDLMGLSPRDNTLFSCQAPAELPPVTDMLHVASKFPLNQRTLAWVLVTVAGNHAGQGVKGLLWSKPVFLDINLHRIQHALR